jgi:hypothetical protein
MRKVMEKVMEKVMRKVMESNEKSDGGEKNKLERDDTKST